MMMYQEAIEKLRGILAVGSNSDPVLKDMIASRDAVYSRYQKLFAASNLHELSRDEFRDFLLIKNNHHWEGIHRQVNSITAEMPRLREALSLLIDESVDLRQRLDNLMPKKGVGKIPGLGRAIITPILHIMYPAKYGVWNTTSMAGMQSLDLWPSFKYGASFAERYVIVNEQLLKIAGDLGIDLWHLDALWWRVNKPVPIPPPETTYPPTGEPTGEHLFGLEKHLHDFLVDNWCQRRFNSPHFRRSKFPHLLMSGPVT